MLRTSLRRARALAIRATLPFRPRLTVIVLGEAQASAAAVDRPSRRVQVLGAGGGHPLRHARGAFVMFVDGRDGTPQAEIDAVSRAAFDGVAVVPLAPGRMKPRGDACYERAVTTLGTAFPRGAARASLTDDSLRACPSAVAANARVVAHLEHRPKPVRLSGPATPRVPRTVDEELAAALATVADLGALDAAAPRGALAATAARFWWGERVGRALSSEPQRLAEVTAVTEAVAADGFSRQALNAGRATTLLVTYAFPPYLDTSGFVAARRFADRGEPYDVVTQSMKGHRPVDERSLALARGELGRRMLVEGPAAFGSWATIEKYVRRGMEQVADREAERGEYEAVYSRSMWAASTVLAAWYKARHPHVPWTAELSDPLTQRPTGDRRPNLLPDNDIVDEIDAAVRALGRPGWIGERLFDGVEWMAYALADRIIFTNENQRRFMIDDFYNPELRERAESISEVSHHPIPPAELYAMAEPADVADERVTVAYFGRFYGVRGVGDLLEPFARLTTEERSRVRLLIFTTDSAATRAEVSVHAARDCVEVRDALPYFEFLATTKAVDWLIVADAHRPASFAINPYLPSKLADYLGSGTNVWALAEPGSVLSREPVDAVSALGDVDAAATVLRDVILRGR